MVRVSVRDEALRPFYPAIKPGIEVGEVDAAIEYDIQRTSMLRALDLVVSARLYSRQDCHYTRRPAEGRPHQNVTGYGGWTSRLQ